MNPYYLTGDGLGYPAFTNGGYSSAGSNTSSPAGVAGPSASGSTSASGTAPATGTASAPSGPSGGTGAASGSTTGNGGLLTGPLVHPHQDLNEFLESFWTRQMAGVEHETPDFKTYNLPLARIKKVMKSDEEVKMISAEAPIMFSKACEIFISELTCRAWLVAEGHKRRTLQKSDVAAAIAFSDVFDFLIDIVPRDDGGSGAGTSGGGGGGGGNGAAGSGNGDAPAVPAATASAAVDDHVDGHHGGATQGDEWTADGEYDDHDVYDGGYEEDGRDGEALYSEKPCIDCALAKTGPAARSTSSCASLASQENFAVCHSRSPA
ncbi:uncharacterized protein EHS24_004902 [Apiotrichum porosum]|uniref:Core Histone H2A/H2B/H3 domain-containing protein n=1 Tax=Apiotrichum porosum TaxID=105984 RepID=A0A427Y6B5_9TREE|nr:uncharacterized protein EHS24_004902 [Apiotrichum porosum]RSH86631.1 hypothetical protein EHS24_004902 [Apiotrichum porosum]